MLSWACLIPAGAKSSDQAAVHQSIVIAADKILADFIAAKGVKGVICPSLALLAKDTILLLK